MNKYLPSALLDSLENVKGFNRQSFEAVHASAERITSIRLNPQKWPANNGDQLKSIFIEHSPLTTHHSLPTTHYPVPWCPYGYYLTERPSFTKDPYLHAGMYYVQEASSMFLWEALKQSVGDETEGLKVLDLCAAPGGKSTLLASYFIDGLLVANEVIKSRASILAENIAKWGSGNVVVTNSDPKNFQSLAGYFDVMMIDAPCSGSGLFRRDPDAVNECSEENVILCSQRQQRIVADACHALKRNGLLIYSTCSYSVAEDEEILDWLCTEMSFTSIKLEVKEEWNIVEVQSEKEQAYGYRFYPDKVKGEGFFIAILKKMGTDEFTQRKPQLTPVTKNELAVIHDWLDKKELFFFKQQDNILAVPSAWQNDIALLQKHLYIRKAGITAGSIKGKDLVPHHELALSLWMSENISTAELDLPEALNYLKKKDIALPAGTYKGWTLATYKNANLGWMKILPNRVNNYYPVEWRILKDL